jgi:hypothetical protein
MRRIFLWWMTVNELTYHRFKMYAIFAFFLSCFIHAHTLLRICSLYRGFLYCRDQKKCSLFRVGRCSLYRGLFTAKIDRGTRTCVQRRGVHFIEVFIKRGFTVVRIGSSQVSSTFGVYKCPVFSEILARNCALVFLEHHQPTQHGWHSIFIVQNRRLEAMN